VDSIDSIIQSIPPATSVSIPEIIRVPNSIFSKFEKILISKMKQFIKMLKNVGRAVKMEYLSKYFVMRRMLLVIVC